jgi:hypothetical protein
VRALTVKYMSCERTACGEQTACAILNGGQLSMAMGDLSWDGRRRLGVCHVGRR